MCNFYFSFILMLNLYSFQIYKFYRSAVSEQNKIEMLAPARMNEIPLDFLFRDQKGMNCLEIATKRAEPEFASRIVKYLLQDLEKVHNQKNSNLKIQMREYQANNNELKMMNEELRKRGTELQKKWQRKFKDRENEVKEDNRKHKIEAQKLKVTLMRKIHTNGRRYSNEKVAELEDLIKNLQNEKQNLKKEVEQVQERLVSSENGGESE